MNQTKTGKLISEMTLAEKADQMAVRNRAAKMENLLVQEGNERLGIPPLRQIDGPRGTHLLSRQSKSPCFPVPLALAATWDVELVETTGVDMARRMKALDAHQLYTPGLNIITDPRCGRNGEYFSEDPLISGEMAASMVRGIESGNVVSTPKHYACNNFEAGRFVVDVQVPERVLHEIYLEGFRIMLSKSRPRSIMTSYNSVNGHFTGANKTLTDLLWKWGFEGFIVSDWGANLESATAAIKAGISIDMPGYRFYTEELFQEALDAGEITMEEIDGLVERVLNAKAGLGLHEREPLNESLEAIASNEAVNALLPASRELCRMIGAESCVLLKNEESFLPLPPETVKSVAVIGPMADSDLVIGNQGSSTVWPEYGITVKEGLATIYDIVASAEGCDCFSYPGAALKNDIVFHAEYFNGLELEGTPAHSCEEIIDHSKFIGEKSAQALGYDTSQFIDVNLTDETDNREPTKKAPTLLPGIANAADMSARWTGTLEAERDGKYYFRVFTQDGARLFVDGINQFDSWQENHIEGQYHYAWFDLEAGKHELVVECRSQREDGFITFEYTEPPQEDIFDEAREAARGKDAVVLCIGVHAQLMQAEGNDNSSFSLPGWQDELVAAVREVNPNTAIVLFSCGGLDMSCWIDEIPAVVQAWHQSQEAGNSIADILSGLVNPSGKLTVTFPQSKEQLPQSVVRYDYGTSVCDVGYRKFDAQNQAPRFEFGFGLSYTAFEYSNLSVDGHTVCFDLTNTGTVDGKEISQVYVASKNPSVERPVRELKGFAKTALAAGETRRVTVELSDHAFSYYDTDTHDWMEEPGDFEIQIGASSRDIRLHKTMKKG